MEIEIVGDENNVLLKRREVKFKVSYAGATPIMEDVRSKLVAILNSDKKLTVLDYVKSDYGRHSAQGYVKVYADAEAMKVEPAYKLKRNFEVKKAEGGEDSAAAGGIAPKEEPKKDESKEAAKAPKAEAPKKEAAAEAPKKEAHKKEAGKKAAEEKKEGA